jgi:hypothetical protein
VPAILVPASGAILGAADAPGGLVTFSGTAVAGASVAVEVASVAVCHATAAADRTWSCQSTAALTEGVNEARATAKNADGTSPRSAAASFTLDLSLPPAPSVLVPAAGAHLAVDDLVSGLVTISGATVADRVVVLVDGQFVATVDASGGAWSVAWQPPSSGSYTAGARALSPAGNPSAPGVSIFTVSLARLASVLSDSADHPWPPVTSWGQSIPDPAAAVEVFVGQANSWVLDADLSLATGWGQQFGFAQLLGTRPTSAASFDVLSAEYLGNQLAYLPRDQQASGLTFLSPRFGAADGVVTAASSDGASMGEVALDGQRSAFLNGTSDSRLSQPFAFVDPSAVYTISWSQSVVFDPGPLATDTPPYAPQFQVVLRNGTGAALAPPLYVATASSHEPQTIGVPGLGGTASLSFELHAPAGSFAEIDDVTMIDPATGTSTLLPNGDFETAGLAPWTANGGSEAQNVRSAPRFFDPASAASTIRVTRTFYAPPAATWGRMVDVFENAGTAPVSTSAVYVLSRKESTPAAEKTQGGAALVAWDVSGMDRDVGLVFGKGTAYVSTGTDGWSFVVHDLVIPPGGKVAIVHFVVQLAEATAGIHVPADTDAECGKILAGFPGVDAYWQDLEPGAMKAVQNF